MNIRSKVTEKERIVMDKFLTLNIGSEEYVINLSALTRGRRYLLDEGKNIKDGIFEHINHEDDHFYVYSRNNKLYVTKNLNRAYNRKIKLHSKITKNYTYFYGLISNIENNSSNRDNIFLNDKKVGEIKRPFKDTPKLKHIGIIKISNEDILKTGEIHSIVKIGKSVDESAEIELKRKTKGMNYYSRKKLKDDYLLIRSTIGSRAIRIVHVGMQPEYSFINTFKNYCAYTLSKIIGKKDIILMFEKETNKANESGYYVFEKIMDRKEVKTPVYFVINKKSDDYKKVKRAYPNNTLDKYSFKHYLYIYISKCFISSELSNHVINPRLYIKSINEAIRTKPLIFLQHGIMFAKPVDNPAAAGFRKQNGSVKFYKCIISSELEAEQFYKLGFERRDLIKCGLTKFDISKQSPDADKIMFMPTYRYWEEGQVMNPKTIKNTTYYKNYMNVINKFKEEGLLDKLSISCHPKFADCLINADPLYEGIVEKDINKGLENAKVFITDYSSASYDAHYRGAYVIYYWAEKDYLIENYQAYPPVDETNCDGVPVYDVDSLIKEVKKAIKNNYKMDKKYEDRYKKINEFHDGKNGDRLVDELIRIGII